MYLSIIIPTLEEEKYLPLLLQSIKEQKFSGKYEIVIADAGSQDKTVEIATNYGCKIIKGGLPAKGRNEGAKIAKGELILFVDADAILPKDSLDGFILEFERRNLDTAGFLLQPCGNDKWFRLLYNVFYNLPVVLLERILPHSVGTMLVKKDFFQKIGGFDEKIILAEDHIYCRKASRYGKFGIIKSYKIYHSQRRLERDGIIKTYLKYLLGEAHLIFEGPIRSDIFQYDLQSRRFKD